MPTLPWDRFAAELRLLYEPPLRAAATRRVLVQALRELAEVGAAKTSDFTPALLARWIAAHPKRSAARTGALLRALQPAAKYAHKIGYLRANPFEFRSAGQWVRLDCTGGRRSPDRHKTVDQIARVLARSDEEAAGGSWESGRLQALVYCYAYLGVRKCEAIYLEVADVDLVAGTATIRPKEGWTPKTLKSAAVLPLAAPLAAVLARWTQRTGCKWLFPGRRSGKPWTGGPPGKKPLDEVRKLGERAGVESLTILGFRKSWATNAKGLGIGPLEVKAALRHTELKTQEFYDEYDRELLAAAIRKVNYRIGTA